ncbi:hypothetical protein PC116_g30362, partial [Phytophthora cactorum]
MVTLFCAVVGVAGSAFPVDIDANKSVGHLKDAIKEKNAATITCDAKDLQLFLAKKGGAWLTQLDALEGWRSGRKWDVGVVHKIPLIWEFMSSLGGCTTRGEFFWRIEDKQVVSVLVDGWFRASSPSSINVRANKKSIVMGSPGIGKSTLLCLMAFYLIFKHKKNVLVYRRLTKLMEENCLLYLGYEGDKVVYFSVLSCEVSEAKRIYRALRGQHGASNVWLLLDGFHYRQIPEGIQTFNLLATSQQVDFKEHEITDAYLCLFPCWRKQDLIKLGEQVYHFD